MEAERPAWYVELLDEVRRAGRAAVAARAAAEACEESVERLERAAPAAPDGRRLLEAILPVCDALGRMAEAARNASPPRGWLEQLRESRRTASELRALRDAVVLLDAQLTSALESSGVAIDRDVGGPVDPDRHRVVETRTVPGEHAGTVVRVVRPGYRLGPVRVREADVVANR